MIIVSLKDKKICKTAVETLPFVISYVLEQCKTHEVCNKVTLENGETLKSIPDC